jgi:fibronectin-binding autotransporter adhesin
LESVTGGATPLSQYKHEHRTTIFLRIVAVVLVCLLAFASSTFAQTTQTWDPNGPAPGTGGTGTWDVTSALWTPDGTTFVTWNNAAGDNALFAGVAGTVTVTAVTVHDLTFNTDGYVLNGGAITLTGATPSINVGAAMTTTINSVVAGASSLTLNGGGTLVLGGNNSYSGITTISAGTLQLGSGGTSGAIGGGDINIATGATLTFNRSDALTIANTITGTGTITQAGAGATTLSGAATAVATNVTGGSLVVTGSLTSPLTAQAGTTLSGTGTVNGTVTVGGTLAPGVAGAGLLTVGNLVLNTGSTLAYDLGAPNVVGGANNDLLQVNGNLTLGGSTLNVTDSGSFATTPGSYRLINYTGTLTGNASNITLGTTPGYTPGQVVVQTAVAGEVNLIATVNGLATQFWDGGGTPSDGAIGGGTGNWDNALGNWANINGSVNQSWLSGFGVFGATAGTVTLTDNVNVAGLQFSTTGYVVNSSGSTVTLTGLLGGRSVIRVDNGVTATFAPAMAGTAGLQKASPGTLILTGDSNYTGGTLIAAGILQLGNAGTTGSITGDVINNATLTFNRSNALTFAGAISGAGTIVQAGTGTTTLSGAAAASATNVNAGTLLVANTLASPVTVASGATLGGTGTITGTTTIGSGGTLAPGAGGAGTLTLTGLNLQAGSILSYDLGTPNVVGGANDLAQVNGNLTLGGSTLNVANNGTFASAAGSYRLINYTGALTGGSSNIALGTLPGVPPNTATVQTAVVGQVNLIVGNGLTLNFWDGPNITSNGVVDGGTGNWDSAAANWTNVNGSFNQSYIPGLAIFTGAAGTVTLTDNVAANVIQFSTTGYAVAGAQTITLLSQTGVGGSAPGLIRTDPGVIANIGVPIAGTVGLEKGDAGTLILSEANTYIGGTTISGGTLQIGNDNFTGSIIGDVLNNGTLAIARTNVFDFTGVISGTGSLVKLSVGTTRLTGNSVYTGGTTISAGTLQLGNGGATGSIVGDVVDNAALAFNRSDSMTFAGAISGIGAVTQAGIGTTILTGANTYAGLTTIGAGTLQIGNGGTTGTLGTAPVVNDGTLTFNRSDALAVANTINGAGTIVQAGGGTTTLSGSAAASATNITGGTLLVTGTLTSPVTAFNGATLGGTGAIAGTVTINGGATLAPGVAGAGTLTLANLTLNAGSILGYDLGTPNVIGGANNDLLQVNGNLTLGGSTLNVTDTGTFASTAGSYRLINYTGALTGNASNITLGTLPGLPPNNAAVQTAVAGQVNLIVSNGLAVNFWDGPNTTSNGAVSGGAGNWDNTTTNWTSADGSINQSYIPGLAIFGGAAGAVTLGANVSANAIQFTAGGYSIAPTASETITLLSQSLTSTMSGLIRTDAGVTASIAAPIAGTVGLEKAGAGTLILAGANTYSGGTTITAGTLQIGNGGLAGTLGAGAVTNNASLVFNRTDALSIANTITGTGTVAQAGTGTTILTGTNSYTGGTTIAAGTLQLGNGGTTGGIVGNVTDNGVLAFNRSDTLTFAGVISGLGGVSQVGTGTTILSGANTYTGTTAISAGTLQLAAIGSLGSGTVLNNGTLTVNRSDAITVANTITGSGVLVQAGTGSTSLTGIVAAGSTNVAAGTLRVNGTLTTPTLTVATGATLGGAGAIIGSVTVANGGTLAPGNSPGTLTMSSLLLSPGSILNYELGTPNVVGVGVNDLIVVNGNLTLAGTLNVTALSGFGLGVYRLINYTGTLTDDVLSLGAVPTGFAYAVNNAVPGQVNLRVLAPTPPDIQYWDGTGTVGNGAVQGGSGTWTLGSTNWTDPSGGINTAWGGRTAVFTAAPGVVTVVGPIGFTALQFLTDGYSIVPGAGGVLSTNSANAQVLLSGGTDLISAPITGGGGLDVQGSGILLLSGNNNYSGATIVGANTIVEVGTGGTSGSIAGAITTNGVIGFNRTDVVTIGNTIDGTGQLRQDGTGTTVLTGANSYAGGTTINAGILSVSQNANLGAPASAITMNGGTLQTTATFTAARATLLNGGAIIDTSSGTTFTQQGAITGAGSLTKTSGGILVLTGINSYSGGTLVSAGTLQGTTNGLQGTIIDNAAVVFDQSFNGTFNGALYGPGTLTKNGSGTVLLTGNQALQGLTTIQTGTLALDGTMADAVTVAKGGTFDANGAIAGALNVNGTVTVRSTAAGGFGQLGVVGNAVFNPGSVYGVSLEPNGGRSTLVAAGTANINGAIVAVSPKDGTYGRVTSWAVLGAAKGLSGVATATSSSPLLDPILTYTSDTLYVTLLNYGSALQPHASTGNGWAVGGALDIIKIGATGDLLNVVRTLTAMPDPALGRALDQISGEIHASAMQLAAVDGDSVMDVTRSELTNRISLRGGLDGSGLKSSTSLWGAQPRRIWVRVRGDHASFDAGGLTAGQGGLPAAHGGDETLEGITIGADWTHGDHWLVGIGGSYGHGKLTLDGLNEWSTLQAPRALGYVGYSKPQWALVGGGSFAYTYYDMERSFAFSALGPTGQPLVTPINRTATSSPSGPATELWFEPRYNFLLGEWDLQPTGSLRAAWYHQNAWTESGADSLSLTGPETTVNSTQAGVGIRFSRVIGGVRPFVSGFYRHELTDGFNSTMAQIGPDPRGLYRVDGIALARNVTIGQGGLTFIHNSFGLSLIYQINVSSPQIWQSLQLGIGF